MLTSLFLSLAGFLFGAAAFYFIHRVVFHSKRSSKVYRFLFHRLNPLRRLALWGRAIHTRHHTEHIRSKKRETPEEMSMFFPWRVKVLILVAVAASSMISIPFTIGVVAFFPFYTFRHTKVHRFYNSGKPLKKWMLHHLYHHEKDPTVNHSGTIPFVDKIFQTHKEPEPAWVEEIYLTHI